MDHFHLKDGVLHCEGVPLPRIAAEIGTPVYVYSTATMVRHAGVMKAALAGLADPLIAYAVKANPNVAVLATLARQGLGADIVSGGEYARARAAGIAAEKIVFSGVGKTADEMARALEGGLYQFNLESLEEAEMLSQVAASMGLAAPVGFRVNPDVAAGTHAKITTGSAENKFGIPIGDAPAAYARIRRLPGMKVQGVAVHIGSQLTSLAPLEAAFARVGALIAELRAVGCAIEVADLGGGLGVPYNPALPEPPSPADYGAMVRRIAGDWGVRLVFEPGRLITGNAGVLLTRVIRVKPGATHPFLIVDAAMNDLMRPALYDAWHEIGAVEPKGPKMTTTVVGPVCESGDTFATAREMDEVAADDLVVFRTAGAYGAAMANSYNSRAVTPEVLVDGDRWAVVRKRIEVAELIAGDAIPDWLARPVTAP
ncbi:diaminopimelate decarboxylase [Sphingosinicella sp. LHD-64]|uniref:diaminopimelate decarboxylase n=1 Tax=Sphingosinicella sp. LHD-64 TaxID=3072139 RepID=UPI00280FB0BE|nr:diaminopimelate decarboxylase [Sphingosinicella sp. LHD-64]MDQ8758072.1 diaminopimelate decarboxylase [Sphingosinicella sp. LHD-64]